jgi:vacuolar protein sorting-associated protein VTA1
MNLPAAVKSSAGLYVRRAEEIEKDTTNPDADIIAFWCRQWALEKALPKYEEEGVPQFVDSLMITQENNKAKAGDKTIGKGVCENHAHLMFDRADSDDRAGKVTQLTAKLFYNSAAYFDILEQFDELKEDADILTKRKHAKWKATDILQAIREGRAPTPSTNTSTNALPPQAPALTPQPSTFPSAPSASASSFDIPQAGSSVIASIGNVMSNIGNSFVTQKNSNTNIKSRPAPKTSTDPRVQDAIELSSFAISSMKYGDIASARIKLTEALRRLE